MDTIRHLSFPFCQGGQFSVSAGGQFLTSHDNFAISANSHAAKGIEHLGIQVESQDELAEVYSRLSAADRPVLEEGATTCCYAKSEKSWIADPQGVVWEAFYTSGDATDYGNSPKLSALSGNAADDACCGQAMPTAKLGCCG